MVKKICYGVAIAALIYAAMDWFSKDSEEERAAKAHIRWLYENYTDSPNEVIAAFRYKAELNNWRLLNTNFVYEEFVTPLLYQTTFSCLKNNHTQEFLIKILKENTYQWGIKTNSGYISPTDYVEQKLIWLDIPDKNNDTWFELPSDEWNNKESIQKCLEFISSENYPLNENITAIFPSRKDIDRYFKDCFKIYSIEKNPSLCNKNRKVYDVIYETCWYDSPFNVFYTNYWKKCTGNKKIEYMLCRLLIMKDGSEIQFMDKSENLIELIDQL